MNFLFYYSFTLMVNYFNVKFNKLYLTIIKKKVVHKKCAKKEKYFVNQS